MSDAKRKEKPTIVKREPQKRTSSGIFDNLRPLPHPMEEILGLQALDKTVQNEIQPPKENNPISDLKVDLKVDLKKDQPDQLDQPKIDESASAKVISS